MKKALSVLLVLLMLLSMAALVACAKEAAEPPAADTETPAAGTETSAAGTETSAAGAETPAAGTETPAAGKETPPAEEGVTQEMLEASLPKEYMREKAAAGMEPIIAFMPPSLASDLMVMFDNGMREAFAADGFGYMSSSFDADTTKLLEQMENYTTMGVSMIITMIFDNGMADEAAKVTDAGIHLVLWSFAPEFPVSMAMISDEYSLGQVAANMASHWVAQQYPNAREGEVHAAMLTSDMNQTYITRFNGLREGLNANPTIDLVYEESNTFMTIETGYNFAQAALTFDPEIRLFVSMTSSQAMGVNNYVLAQGYSAEELKEFAAFGTDNDASSREMIDVAKAGGDSILRGLVGSGTDNPADYVIDFIYGLIDGEYPEGSIVATPQYSYDAVGFDYDERV